jgi:hypothetical protein
MPFGAQGSAWTFDVQAADVGAMLRSMAQAICTSIAGLACQASCSTAPGTEGVRDKARE